MRETGKLMNDRGELNNEVSTQNSLIYIFSLILLCQKPLEEPWIPNDASNSKNNLTF